MLKLPHKSVNLIKKYLLRQQKEVEENLKEVEKDDPATTPALAESTEPGTDSWVAEEHTKIAVFRQQLKNLGSGIKDALFRIKNSTYGKCEKCGQQIGLGRLLAMPTASLCLACSKKVSKK